MPTEVMEIKAVGKDQVTAELKKVQRSLKGIEKELQEATAASGRMQSAMAKVGTAASAVSSKMKAFQALLAGSLAVDYGKQLFEMGKQGAIAADQFDVMAKRVANLPQLMDEARIATNNMIPDEELLQSIAIFDSFDIPVREIPRALEQVTKTAARTGQSASFLAQSLSTGVARMSAPILDNLGVQLKMAKVTEAATAQFGKQATQLTDTEKKTALLNMTLDQLAGKNADVNLNELRTASFAKLETVVANAKIELGEYLAEVINLYDLTSGDDPSEQLAESFSAISEAQSEIDTDTWGGLGDALSRLVLGATELSEQMDVQSEAVRAAGAALRRLPVEERKAAFDNLLGTFTNIPHALRLMIAELGGVDLSMASVSATASAATYTFSQFFGELQDYAGYVASGGAPASIRGEGAVLKEPKRRGGGGGGRRQSAERELAASERRRAIEEAGTAEERVRLEIQMKMQEVDDRAAEMLKLRLDQKRVEAFVDERKIQLMLEESDALDEIEESRKEVLQSQKDFLAGLAAEKTEAEFVLALSNAELEIARTKDPLVRAQLELERERMAIAANLAAMTEQERNSTLAQADAQAALNRAMYVYGENVKKIKQEKLADQFAQAGTVASSASGSLGALNEDLGNMLGSLQPLSAAWGQYAKGQLDVASATVASAGGIGAAAAGMIEDEQVRAGVMAAIEAAMSVAAFARLDIGAGIAHATAASMFTAVAAGAVKTTGGGGGSSSAASAAASAQEQDEQKGGFEDSGRSVIVQFGSGVILGDPQAVASAVNQAAYSARGTGHSAGY